MTDLKIVELLDVLGSHSGTEKVPPKNLRDKDFAKLSSELSGAICLKTLVLLASALDLFRNSLVLFVRYFGFEALCSAIRFRKDISLQH